MANTDEIDLAFSTLEDTSGAEASPPPLTNAPAPPSLSQARRSKTGVQSLGEVRGVQLSPPPVEKPHIDPATYQRRHAFGDLFVGVAPGSPPRGGVEEKLEYFRERVRALEATLHNAEVAFATRDAELDAVELLWGRERTRAEGLQKQARDLQEFINQKKAELESFNAKVKEAMAAREIAALELRDELERAQDALVDANATVAKRDEIIKRMSQGVDETRRELSSLRGLVAEKDRALELKDQQIAELQWRVSTLEREALTAADNDTEVERLRMALRAERAKVKKLEGG